MSDTRQLDDLLGALRTRIDALESEDVQAKQHLAALMDEIDSARRTPGDGEAQSGLDESVKSSILRFESSHPRIAGILNDIAAKLGDMGI